MPTTTWNTTTIGGQEYLVIDTAQFRVPLDWDPSSNMFIAVAAPTGGLGSFPALVKGDTGDTPTLDNINFTVLESGDPTPDAASWTETAPGVYQLNISLHKGPQGDTGDTIVTPTDFGTPVVGKIPVVNAALDNFELQTQKVGDRYVPAAISNTPSGNATWTLCSIPIPAQDFDWRPECSGQVTIVPTDHNTRVDLIARLNTEISGNIVGRAFGRATSWWENYDLTEVMSPGPPPAASSTYDKVAAGAAATIYIRAERINGSGTFTTTADTSYFQVRVCPIP